MLTKATVVAFRHHNTTPNCDEFALLFQPSEKLGDKTLPEGQPERTITLVHTEEFKRQPQHSGRKQVPPRLSKVQKDDVRAESGWEARLPRTSRVEKTRETCLQSGSKGLRVKTGPWGADSMIASQNTG